MIGDKDIDMEAAAAAGVEGALIREEDPLEPFVAALLDLRAAPASALR